MRKMADSVVGDSTQTSKKQTRACQAVSGQGVQIVTLEWIVSKDQRLESSKWVKLVEGERLACFSAQRPSKCVKGMEPKAMLASVMEDQSKRHLAKGSP